VKLGFRRCRKRCLERDGTGIGFRLPSSIRPSGFEMRDVSSGWEGGRFLRGGVEPQSWKHKVHLVETGCVFVFTSTIRPPRPGDAKRAAVGLIGSERSGRLPQRPPRSDRHAVRGCRRPTAMSRPRPSHGPRAPRSIGSQTEERSEERSASTPRRNGPGHALERALRLSRRATADTRFRSVGRAK